MGRMRSEKVTKPISLRVVESLAAAREIEPLDMDPPLFDVIDPEALDRLFRSDAECRVTFEYEGHEVVVRNDGRISIDGTPFSRP